LNPIDRQVVNLSVLDLRVSSRSGSSSSHLVSIPVFQYLHGPLEPVAIPSFPKKGSTFFSRLRPHPIQTYFHGVLYRVSCSSIKHHFLPLEEGPLIAIRLSIGEPSSPPNIVDQETRQVLIPVCSHHRERDRADKAYR